MHILAIDRGSKKIGLARWSSNTKITFPLGFLPNTLETLADLLHLIEKHTITLVVYGEQHIPHLQKQLQTLREQIKQVFPDLVFVSCNEAYTSVQADILLEQANHAGQDAVAAMYILDTYLETTKNEK